MRALYVSIRETQKWKLQKKNGRNQEKNRNRTMISEIKSELEENTRAYEHNC